MSNGTIFTGKSADGSDMQVADGVFDYGDGTWGTTPRKRTAVERMYAELAEHLVKHERTFEEEYDLIQQKKSHLSRRMRDFVVLVKRIDDHEKAHNEKAQSTETENKESV